MYALFVVYLIQILCVLVSMSERDRNKQGETEREGAIRRHAKENGVKY